MQRMHNSSSSKLMKKKIRFQICNACLVVLISLSSKLLKTKQSLKYASRAQSCLVVLISFSKRSRVQVVWLIRAARANVRHVGSVISARLCFCIPFVGLNSVRFRTPLYMILYYLPMMYREISGEGVSIGHSWCREVLVAQAVVRNVGRNCSQAETACIITTRPLYHGIQLMTSLIISQKVITHLHICEEYTCLQFSFKVKGEIIETCKNSFSIFCMRKKTFWQNYVFMVRCRQSIIKQ